MYIRVKPKTKKTIMKKSLSTEITKLLHQMLEFEMGATDANIKTIKNIVAHHLDKLIYDIKNQKFLLDVGPNELLRLQVLTSSALNTHQELGAVLLGLLTAEEEKKKYFES